MFDMFQGNDEASPLPAAAPQAGDTFVVSVGGSIIFGEDGPSPEKIRAIADVINQLHYSGKKIAVVVGGGKTARAYVEASRALALNNFEQDILGIQVTRANAALVAAAIPNAHKEILTEITRAKQVLDDGKIPVFGGVLPFFTTDSVAALIAEFLNATFVNLTNVDGIYDSNPKDNPEAVMFSEISYSRLVSLVLAAGSVPGQNVVVDLPCAMILKRSRVPAVVLNGNDLNNFSAYINGQSFVGTVIREIPGEDSEAEMKENVSDFTEIDSPEKKPRKKRARKPAVKKAKDDYSHPSPYQIDF